MLGDPRLAINAVALCADQPLLPPEVMHQLQEKSVWIAVHDRTF